MDLTLAWEISNLHPYYPTYVVRRRWRRVKETLRKVIDFKMKGLKLTCGAGYPVGRGLVESRQYAAEASRNAVIPGRDGRTVSTCATVRGQRSCAVKGCGHDKQVRARRRRVATSRTGRGELSEGGRRRPGPVLSGLGRFRTVWVGSGPVWAVLGRSGLF